MSEQEVEKGLKVVADFEANRDRARFLHAQAVVNSFAQDIEAICAEYRMSQEVRQRLLKAVSLARLAVR